MWNVRNARCRMTSLAYISIISEGVSPDFFDTSQIQSSLSTENFIHSVLTCFLVFKVLQTRPPTSSPNMISLTYSPSRSPKPKAPCPSAHHHTLHSLTLPPFPFPFLSFSSLSFPFPARQRRDSRIISPFPTNPSFLPTLHLTTQYGVPQPITKTPLIAQQHQPRTKIVFGR